VAVEWKKEKSEREMAKKKKSLLPLLPKTPNARRVSDFRQATPPLFFFA
jgi:hypothetical protein